MEIINGNIIGGGPSSAEQLPANNNKTTQQELDELKQQIDDLIAEANRLKSLLNDKINKSGAKQQIEVTSGDTVINLKSNSTWSFEQFTDKNNITLGYLGVGPDKKPYFYDTSAHQLALSEELNNLVKTKTITGTTNVTGCVMLNVSAPNIVIGAKIATSGGYEVYPFLYVNGNWYAKIMNNTNTYSIVGNTSVTLLVYYI